MESIPDELVEEILLNVILGGFDAKRRRPALDTPRTRLRNRALGLSQVTKHFNTPSGGGTVPSRAVAAEGEQLLLTKVRIRFLPVCVRH